MHGASLVPSEDWTLAAGGRIYDKWWGDPDRPEPEATNPVYPVAANAEQTGSGTRRCRECHSWDHQGVFGIHGKGSHFTGIMGVMGMRAPVKGAGRKRPFIKDETRKVIPGIGDVDRGRAIFQTTCAACHGFDGRAMDRGGGRRAQPCRH